jgi:hypothetical protein
LGSKCATLVIDCLQPSGELEYLNCAHVPPLIATARGRVARLRESNVPFPCALSKRSLDKLAERGGERLRRISGSRAVTQLVDLKASDL